MKVRVDGLFLLVVVVLGLVVWGWSKRKEIAETVEKKVNPASTENVIYDNLVGGIGRRLTGDPQWSLGGQIYDWVN